MIKPSHKNSLVFNLNPYKINRFIKSIFHFKLVLEFEQT